MTYPLYMYPLYIPTRPLSGLRGSLTGVVSLIVLLLLTLPGRAAAQGRDSVQVDIVFKSKSEPRDGYNFCFANAIGVHPDPVGNGDDNDYRYSYPRRDRTPPDWTGLQDDIPGERITYLVSGNSGGDGGGRGVSCGEQLAGLKAGYEDLEVWAYYTPPSNEPPSACFDFEEADEPLAVDFDASCSNDRDGDVVQYDWDFGGEGSEGGSGAQTTFTYEEPGIYTVTLVVKDDDGDESNLFIAYVNVGDELVVNSTGDDPDEDDEDLRCDTGQKITRDGEEEDECTLRAAIEEANARGGATITFDIEADGVPRIDVEEFASAPVQGHPEKVGLPVLEAPITIDGTTQPGTGWVEISGPGNRGDWDSNSGLWIGTAGGGSTIHGLVINRFDGAGLVVQGDGCHIEGNRIGTDATGTQARGNTWGRGGLYVLGSQNVIADNVIAGNVIEGFGAELMISSSGKRNEVVGNRIGVGADGRIVGHQDPSQETAFSVGIAVGGDDNVIGGLDGDPSGTCEAPCNLIFGYDFTIIAYETLLAEAFLDPPSVRSQVLGNAVGVDAGLKPVAGSPLNGPRIMLGEESTVEGNYIVADNQSAVSVGSSSLVRDNVIVGHPEIKSVVFAGLVQLNGAAAELRGNQITTSAMNGVVLTGKGGHLVVENEIRGHNGGIAVTRGEGNRIEANEITENRLFGVLLSDYFGEPGTLLTRNRIHNTGIGIDLGGGSATQSRLSGDGVTFNDYTDLDDGPNNLLNYPVPLQVRHLGRVVQVEGELWGAYSGEYTVEVFANTSCSKATRAGRSYGAGEHFLGSLTVTPTASDIGTPAFSFVEGGLEEHHRFVTLTVSRADLGVTSEFSPCVWIANAEDVAKTDVEPGKAGKIIEAVGVIISIANAANGKTASSTALHDGGTIYVTRYETAPDTSFFADATATAPGGSAIHPEAVAARYWSLGNRGLTATEGSTVTFEVCLDPAGVVAPSGLDEVVLVQRSEASEGLWQPHATYTSTQNGTTYLCAQNFTTLGEFGLGGAEVAFPVGTEDGEGGMPMDEAEGGVPVKAFGLGAAYPNPFSLTTTIDLTIPESGPVTVAVYDVLGRPVAVLIDDVRTAGLHRAVLDAASLPSGVYLVRMVAGGKAVTQRVTVLR